MNRGSLYILSPYGPMYMSRSQVLMDPDEEERARTISPPPLDREDYWAPSTLYNVKVHEDNLVSYYERKKKNEPPHN